MPLAAIGVARTRAQERARSLVAKGGAVWTWPSIPLTVPQGATIVPVNAEAIRFWISRLHGPEELDKDILGGVSCAAHCLTIGDEIGAQRALDSLRLAKLSRDVALLMCAVADHLGIEPSDLPLCAGPHTWAARDIAIHLPLFNRHFEAGQLLAKGVIAFDESKHPRWPAGALEGQGGQFAPGDASGVSVIPVAARRRYPKRRPPINDGFDAPSTRGIGDNSDKYQELSELPEEEPPPDERYGTVQGVAQTLEEALAAGAVLWVQNYLQGLATILWLRNATTSYYQLKANLDPPKTLEQLQDAVATPTLGYHIHHIVELESGLKDGFSKDLLNSPDNLVEIPEMKHREISNWYQTPNEKFDDVSPRDYLSGKSWEERWEVGIQALIYFRVLKP
jgi:hypothetical protein